MGSSGSKIMQKGGSIFGYSEMMMVVMMMMMVVEMMMTLVLVMRMMTSNRAQISSSLGRCRSYLR